MSNNPDICLKSLKVTSRKKGRFSGMTLIDPFSSGCIFEKISIWYNKAVKYSVRGKVTVDTGHKYKYKYKYRVIGVKNEYDMLQE